MIRTRTATVCLREPGIVQATIDEGAVQTLEHAKENYAACVSFCGKGPLLLLVDIRKVTMLEAEARHYYGSRSMTGEFRAFALLTRASALGKAIGNIYLAIAKHSVPTKLHSNEEDAVQWLKSY